MIELIIMFFEFIFRIIYVYVWYVFPVLLLISLICVFFGMALKVGINAGFGILIILASLIVFSYIVYGSDASFNILQNRIYIYIYRFFKFKLVNMQDYYQQRGDDRQDQFMAN